MHIVILSTIYCDASTIYRDSRSVNLISEIPASVPLHVADSPPTSRIARTRRFGGLVAGQGLRWAGMRAANTLRSEEAADAATGERAAATARELVKQLGQMRGAAMKIGQVLSTVDLHRDPRVRARGKVQGQTLAEPARRRPAAALQARRGSCCAEASLGRADRRPLRRTSRRRRSPRPRSARSTAPPTTQGKRVAVKIQYPGIAEAVETDLRNLQLLLPLVKRLAPGLDVKAPRRSCGNGSATSSTTRSRPRTTGR